ANFVSSTPVVNEPLTLNGTGISEFGGALFGRGNFAGPVTLASNAKVTGDFSAPGVILSGSVGGPADLTIGGFVTLSGSAPNTYRATHVSRSSPHLKTSPDAHAIPGALHFVRRAAGAFVA